MDFLVSKLGKIAPIAILALALALYGGLLHPRAAEPGVEQWSFFTGGNVYSSPSISPDGTIYVGSGSTKLYAISSSSMGLANSPWPIFRHDPRRTGRGN